MRKEQLGPLSLSPFGGRFICARVCMCVVMCATLGPAAFDAKCVSLSIPPYPVCSHGNHQFVSRRINRVHAHTHTHKHGRLLPIRDWHSFI